MANRLKTAACTAMLLAGLASCGSDPYPAYIGPPQVSHQTFRVGDTVEDNCRVASKVIIRDWEIADWQTRMAGQAELAAPPSDNLPGGAAYVRATSGVAVGDAPAANAADLPLQQYAISRLHRSAGDADAEVKALVLSVLPPESVAEMRQSPDGKFHLINRTSYGAYVPAACRLIQVCKIRRSSVKNPTTCQPDW